MGRYTLLTHPHTAHTSHAAFCLFKLVKSSVTSCLTISLDHISLFLHQHCSMSPSSSCSSSSLFTSPPLAAPPIASSSPHRLLRRKCACGKMIITGGRTMRETAILRAAHSQTQQHRQWEETILPTLPCHAPLTLYAKDEEEEEEKNEEQEENEQQEKESSFSSRLITTSTPTKHKDYTSEDPDDTHWYSIPFGSADRLPTQQSRPSVFQSSMVTGAASPTKSPSLLPFPPSHSPFLRPRSRSSTCATGTMPSSFLFPSQEQSGNEEWREEQVRRV